MVDNDLPDPVEKRIVTPVQQESRLFKTLYTLTVFAVVYSSIHKIWIPIFLKFTHVTRLEYQKIDYWVIPAFALWWHLHRKKNLGWFGSFICGSLILQGAVDLLFIAGGKYVGWLTISHLLSSVPLALISIAWLTMARDRKPRAGAAWLGVISGFLAVLFFSTEIRQQIFGSKEAVKVEEASVDFSPGVPALTNPTGCGQKAFWLSLQDYPDHKSKAEITLSECGFAPAMQKMDRFFGFSVKNLLPTSANIHVLVFQTDGSKRGFNRVLRQNESLDLHRGNFNLNEQEFLMVYSDTTPEAGLTALFPNEQIGFRKITRTPLEMVPIDEKTGLPPHSESGDKSDSENSKEGAQ